MSAQPLVPFWQNPCGLPSRPGLGQRACAFFGARYVLGPVKETIQLVHGPVGCGYYGRLVRGVPYPLYTTALTEKEVVFGGLDHLARALREAFALNPEARGAFVYLSCVSGLIGEDVAGLARLFEEKGLPVKTVACPGFSSFSQAGGHALAYEVLLGLVKPGPLAEEPTVNLLGEYNVAGEARVIKGLLEGLGVKVHTVLTGETSWSELEALTRAHLNLLLCGSTAQALAKELKSRFGMPFERVSFYGPAAIARSLKKIAAFFGLPEKKVLLQIRKGEDRLQKVLPSYKDLLSGRRALLLLGAGKLGPLARMLRELGLEVVAAGSIFGREEDHQELRAYTDLVSDNPTEDELEYLLKFLKPDVVLTNARDQWRPIKLGFPTLSFPQTVDRGPYTGYEGFVNLARDLVKVLSAPVWRFFARDRS